MPYLRKLSKIDGHLAPTSLNKDEASKATVFHEDINLHSQIVYRGITKEFALDRFLISEASGGNLSYAAEQIFYFGEKAVACLKGKLNYLPTLRDITLKQMLCLSHEVRIALNGQDYDKKDFTANNPEFYKFFSSKDAAVDLKSIFNKLSKSGRIKLRNMLISFLHTHGENPYKAESALVSTSTSFDFAYKFIKERSNGDEFVILIAWLPQPEQLFSIRAAIPSGYYLELKAADIPTIETEIYASESEVSVMGAIFPHYVFGIFDPFSATTIINHNIFKQSRNNHQCAINGLIIDQSTFKKQLKDKSKYQDGVEMQNDEIEFI